MRAFWITENVAFGPIPMHVDYDDIVRKFDVVVSLIEDEEYRRYHYDTSYFEDMGLKVIKLPTQDFRAPKLVPAMWLLGEILRMDEKGMKVYVHCVGGLGRSGSIAAAYLSYKYGLNHEKAIREVRKKRPGSVQAREQEKFVERVYKIIKRCREDILYKKSLEFLNKLSEDIVLTVSTAVSVYVDIADVFTENPEYCDVYLGMIGELIEGKVNYSESIDMDLVSFSKDLGAALGDKFSCILFNIDSDEITLILECFSYCEAELSMILEKYRDVLSRKVSKEISVTVEYF
ncbi:MAG: hypothetical protein DRN26_04440 [Thermoplasmata archaeon]|nr:MAG: hypothetical protein DRN26_04440 [Thermoplasmata archaeon]